MSRTQSWLPAKDGLPWAVIHMPGYRVQIPVQRVASKASALNLGPGMMPSFTASLRPDGRYPEEQGHGVALVGALRASTAESSPAVRSLMVVIADDGWYEN